MASSSNLPLRQTDPETQRNAPQKDPIPKTCLRLYSDEDAGRRLTSEEYRLSLLNNGPIPNFDWRAVPPAGIGRKFDVAGRVEELQKYLRENTYPNQRKNIMAAIGMYNRKELPKQDPPRVYLQDGKLIAPTMDSVLQPEPIWREVCLRRHARIYLIHASWLRDSIYASTWPLSSAPSATVHCFWVQSGPGWGRGIVNNPSKRYIFIIYFYFRGFNPALDLLCTS